MNTITIHSLNLCHKLRQGGRVDPPPSNKVLNLSNDSKFHGYRPVNSLQHNRDGHCHIVWEIFHMHNASELDPLLSSSGDFMSY